MDMSRSTEKVARRAQRGLQVILGLALLVAATVSACKHVAPREVVAQCSPNVEDIDVGRLVTSRDRNSRLATVYEEDQKDRVLPGQRELSSAEWDEINRRDDSRLEQTVEALRSGDGLSTKDLFYSSVILLHGTCPDHYRLARDLADKLIKLGEESAKSLYAHAVDRYLISMNKPQKYGTQYHCGSGGCALLPYDPATTDAQRAQFDVPRLEDALKGMQ